MSMSTTPAYIATVDEGHVVSIPIEVPVGSRVAILLLPPTTQEEADGERKTRFDGVFAAIRSAIASGYTPAGTSDDELDALIREARRQKPG